VTEGHELNIFDLGASDRVIFWYKQAKSIKKFRAPTAGQETESSILHVARSYLQRKD
jgi:hypothetical protein